MLPMGHAGTIYSCCVPGAESWLQACQTFSPSWNLQMRSPWGGGNPKDVKIKTKQDKTKLQPMRKESAIIICQNRELKATQPIFFFVKSAFLFTLPSAHSHVNCCWKGKGANREAQNRSWAHLLPGSRPSAGRSKGKRERSSLWRLKSCLTFWA